MSENSANVCTILHLRFKLRVPQGVLLAHSREALSSCLGRRSDLERSGCRKRRSLRWAASICFANRETAEAYLNHPVIQAVCSNPAVVSSQSQLWDLESSLSAILRHR